MGINLKAPLSDDPVTLTNELQFVRTVRLQMQKETDAVQEREKAIESKIIDMTAVDAGHIGATHKAIVRETLKHVVDGGDGWDKIYDKIVELDRFDFIQKRLNDKAIEDAIEAGLIPANDLKSWGLTRFHAKKVSLTKI